jgi:Xaa-Pro dipeptidase
MRTTRRALLGWAGAGGALAAGATALAGAAEARASGLKSLTGSAQPISAGEHGARLARVQSLMQQRRIAALLVESGSTLEYFTGIRWWRS